MNRILKTLKILDYYDGPELILSEDQFGAFHCVYFSGKNDEGKEIFSSTLISKMRLKALENGEVSVREIFVSPEVSTFFQMVVDGAEAQVEAVEIAALDEKFLPPEDYILEDFSSEIEANSKLEPDSEALAKLVKSLMDSRNSIPWASQNAGSRVWDTYSYPATEDSLEELADAA